MKTNKEYIGYDYKTIIVSRIFESAWVDSYSSFGWELEKVQPAIEEPAWGPLRVMLAPLTVFPVKALRNLVFTHESSDKVELHFKRDRKIKNKNELNRLQLILDKTLKDMEYMEKTKTFSASVAGYVTGLLGTVCLAIATFGYLASKIAVCIEFAISGFAGWILAFAAYSIMKDKKAKKVACEIENKFDVVNDICMQAHEFVSN